MQQNFVVGQMSSETASIARQNCQNLQSTATIEYSAIIIAEN